MDSIERAKEIRKTWKGTNKEFVDKVGIPARAAHDKKTKALEKQKLTRSEKVGTRKKDIIGGRQGNWMKVMKGDR